jgi:hypothetical protein
MKDVATVVPHHPAFQAERMERYESNPGWRRGLGGFETRVPAGRVWEA